MTSPAETEYRERSALADQCLSALDKAKGLAAADEVPTLYALAANAQATLALAAATLMAAEPPTYEIQQRIVRHEDLDTVEIRDAVGQFSHRVYAGPAPAQPPGESIEDYVDRLNESLEAAQLARIEAQNPGIDMDEVRAHRERIRSGRGAHIGQESEDVDGAVPCIYGCEGIR